MCPEPDIAKLAMSGPGLFHFSRFCQMADQAFCKKRAAHMKCDLRVWDIPTCKRLAKVRQTDPACQVVKCTKMNVNGEHINTDEDKLAEDMDKLADSVK